MQHRESGSADVDLKIFARYIFLDRKESVIPVTNYLFNERLPILSSVDRAREERWSGPKGWRPGG